MSRLPAVSAYATAGQLARTNQDRGPRRQLGENPSFVPLPTHGRSISPARGGEQTKTAGRVKNRAGPRDISTCVVTNGPIRSVSAGRRSFQRDHPAEVVPLEEGVHVPEPRPAEQFLVLFQAV